MAKRRYSNSRKRKSRRGKKSRHTKRHDGRRHHHTRRRVRRGGNTPGPPTIPIPLGSNQLLPRLPGLTNFQRGGSETSTGGSMVYNGGQWVSRNTAGGRA